MQQDQKFKVLTANLETSLEYGKKVQKEIQKMASQIFHAQVSIKKNKEHKKTLQQNNDKLDIALKKQEEQASSLLYKNQKLQIRVTEIEQKIALQEQALTRKQNHQRKMKQKIEFFQNYLENKENFDEQIEEEKKEIQRYEGLLNKGKEDVRNLQSQSFTLKKNNRKTEDEIDWKKKDRRKKESIIEYLDDQSQKQNTNKQNIKVNGNEKQDKLKQLKERKEQIKINIDNKIDSLVLLQKFACNLSKENVQVKQMLTKSDQSIMDIKKQTHRLVKLKQMIKMQEKYR